MAYFPNGTSAEVYMGQFCEHCRNWKRDDATDTFGCPIMDLHIIHNYDDAMRPTLDHFIPQDGIQTGDCKMFDPASDRCTKTPDMFA